MRWHTQAGNITANMRVKIYFTLPDKNCDVVMSRG